MGSSKDIMKCKVVKFGGSSLADAKQFVKVANIIKSDEQRRYVVPSAPGKRFSEDIKVTDMLYQCWQLAHDNEDFSPVLFGIKERYNGIIQELGIDLSLEEEFERIAEGLVAEEYSRDFMASRGEYFCGKVLAKYLGFSFVDAAEVVFFNSDGSLNYEKTYPTMASRLSELENAVIPGFYGSNPDHTIKVFKRGGSDISGAIVASAMKADLYENWTDVDGFLMVDPRMVNNPKIIRQLTYKEMRELSYMGATVLQEDSIIPVRRAGIAINIKNTNNPSAPGTLIVNDDAAPLEDSTITGIAGKKGFKVIAVEKEMMNDEVGFGRKVLSVLEKHGVSFEHIPTGVDTMNVVFQSNTPDKEYKKMLQEIREAVHPDKITLESSLALIAVVGRGMKGNVGVTAKISSALAKTGVNIKMLDQSYGEITVIVGVADEDLITAIRAIYEAFEQ